MDQIFGLFSPGETKKQDMEEEVGEEEKKKGGKKGEGREIKN